MLRPAPASLPKALQNVVEYRKSGLSLNHVVGCPLDCGYCVRHLFANYDMKRPHLVMGDNAAVDLLLGHWAFRRGVTPIQIFNRATDPFLPGVREHLFATVEELDRRRITNPVLVITRWTVSAEDVARLDQLRHLKLTILVTWSGIDDDRVEPVDSTIAAATLETLAANSVKVKKILYWRPVIAGLNDSRVHIAEARRLSGYADATVFTGLFYRAEIREYFHKAGIPDLYENIARRKILPRDVEERVISAFSGRPLFRKTSCGVAFAHRTADYNGHFGIREICSICPSEQLARCAAAHHRPALRVVRELAQLAGLSPEAVSIDDRRIEVRDSSEAQRYFMQHMLNFQVHDDAYPHFPDRHGRADVGW